jgi:hypothetical protein
MFDASRFGIPKDGAPDRMPRMDPHERATSVWYRIAGLISREQKDLAVEIIEAEIRSAQHEVLLEAARLVLSGEPVEIARQLRDQAERTIRPQGTTPRLPSRGRRS